MVDMKTEHRGDITMTKLLREIVLVQSYLRFIHCTMKGRNHFLNIVIQPDCVTSLPCTSSQRLARFAISALNLTSRSISLDSPTDIPISVDHKLQTVKNIKRLIIFFFKAL